MVNPGAFQGLRRQFLMSEKASYKAAVLGGYAADALANIQRRYFLRFPIDLPHDQEPDGAFLAAVNDSAAEEDPQPPDMENLTKEQYEEAVERLKVRRRMIAYRKAQIKRWLAYQCMKDGDMDARESGKHNPYHWMLVKLSGMEAATRPRLRTPVNTWRKSQAKEIDAETRRALGTLPKSKQAAARDKIAKKMFEDLDAEEKVQWAEQAAEDHQERLARWEERMSGKGSTDNADRQRAIQGLTRCMKPLLDMICEATGWKCSLIAGGPEPAHGGRLNMISIHSGETTGDLKVNFGRSERARYQQYFVPTYGDFLKKCYTPEECRSRALPVEEGFEALESLDLDTEDVNFDSLDTMQDLPGSRSASRGPSASSAAHHQPRASTISTSTPSQTRAKDSPAIITPMASATPATIPSPNPAQQPPAPAPAAALPTPATAHSQIPAQEPPARAASLAPAYSPAPTPPASPTRSLSLPPAPSRQPSPVSSSRPIQSAQSHSSHADTPVTAQKQTQDAVVINGVTSPAAAASGAAAVSSNAQQASEGEVQDMVPIESSVSASSTIPAKRVRGPAEDQTVPLLKRTRGQARNTPSSIQTRNNAARDAPVTASTTKPTRSTKSAPKEISSSSRTRGPTASSTSTPSVPAWFTSALSMLKSKDIDARFATLVDTWAAFEAKENYQEVAVLESKGRPGVIGAWIARARRPTYAPKDFDAVAHGNQFKTWWFNLQPAWRREGNEVSWGSITGDLSALKRPGTNGIVSVVAGLFFWGTNVKKDSNGWDTYIACVNDVQAVLSAFVWPPASGSS